MARTIIAIFFLLLAAGAPDASASSKTFTTYGDIAQVALPLGAAAYAFAQRDSAGAGELLETWGATMLTTYGLKYTVHARRPNGGLHSFPSGHSAAAFSASAYMGQRYGWSVGAPMELAAAAVAYSRIDAHAHYWRDVIASAALAHGLALYFVERRPDDRRLRFGIVERDDRFELSGSFKF